MLLRNWKHQQIKCVDKRQCEEESVMLRAVVWRKDSDVSEALSVLFNSAISH